MLVKLLNSLYIIAYTAIIFVYTGLVDGAERIERISQRRRHGFWNCRDERLSYWNEKRSLLVNSLSSLEGRGKMQIKCSKHFQALVMIVVCLVLTYYLFMQGYILVSIVCIVVSVGGISAHLSAMRKDDSSYFDVIG